MLQLLRSGRDLDAPCCPGAGQHPSAGTSRWDEAVPACVTCRGSDQPGAVNYEMLWVAAYTLVYFQSIALLFVLVYSTENGSATLLEKGKAEEHPVDNVSAMRLLNSI